MARGNQRDQAREKAAKAGKVLLLNFPWFPFKSIFYWCFLGSYKSNITYGQILIMWTQSICPLSWISIFLMRCFCTWMKCGVNIFLWLYFHHEQSQNLTQPFFVQGKNKAASDQDANAGLTKEQRMERWEFIQFFGGNLCLRYWRGVNWYEEKRLHGYLRKWLDTVGGRLI